jgi:hypothetical protein
MEDQIAWDYLAVFITLAALAVGLISMAWGKIADWRESREETPPRRRTRQMVARRARPPLPMRVMSRSGGGTPQKRAVVAPAVPALTAALSPIVTPNNEYSSGLSDSGRVQFEATAKTLAALYEAGLVTNLSKSICRAYGCSVQAATKTDSTYQMALKAVNRHLPQQNVPEFRQDDGSTAPASRPITGQRRPA